MSIVQPYGASTLEALEPMYTQFVSRILFPLHERYKSHTSVATRCSMEETQWWPAERLQAMQLERLRSLLCEVSINVPYYSELFARLRFDPAELKSVEDLRALPLLDKATIGAHTEAMKNLKASALARSNTGGSSGEPLVFFIGKERMSHDVAAKWRATRWWGVDYGDRELVVWGSPIELGAQDRVKRLRDWLLRTELLPAFAMNERRLDEMVATIRRRRPRMLFGYPSALSHIARHAESRGVRLDDVGVQVAFVTSERLYDEQRTTISRLFGCPVANGYGGRDAGFIAHECPQGGMHITAEDIVLEFVDRGGQPVTDGEPGEVVVTHLATRDFPFIRYRTGDVAVRDSRRCSCGRGLPMLREIQGRSTDFVVAADGTVMHGLALIYILRELPGLSAFKVVQHDLQRTSVQLVPGIGFDPACERTIVDSFRKRLGSHVTVDIQRVAAIAPEKSGKFRYVVSHIAAS